MLSDSVKFVGPSINCEGAGDADPFRGLGPPPAAGKDADAGARGWVPHVQSFAVATDAAGLELLRARSRVFACHAGRLDAIRSAEVGASAAMLAGGYGIDSFQLKCVRVWVSLVGVASACIASDARRRRPLARQRRAALTAAARPRALAPRQVRAKHQLGPPQRVGLQRAGQPHERRDPLRRRHAAPDGGNVCEGQGA